MAQTNYRIAHICEYLVCSRYHAGCDVDRITPASYKCKSNSAARFNRLAAFLLQK
nr:MAG TPA: antimicrobial protein [Caudoviricetes sp.]